jgi:Na+/melibiose symporter-like transporter
MKSKTKARLSAFANWFASLLVMLIALVFIYSAQAFQDQNLKGLANVFTTVGSAMLSMVSLYMGSRLQQARERKDERRQIRKNEAAIYKEFLNEISNVIEKFKRYQSLVKTGRQNEADLIWYQIRERVNEIQEQRPSANKISEEEYRLKIQQALEQVAEQCDMLVANQSSENLERNVKIAFSVLTDYEELE